MVNAELLKERRDRILKAVALEKPDRIPMVLEYSGFAAYATKTEMADFISSPSKATETMIVAYKLIGGGDAINYGTFSPYRLSYIYGAKVKVPGIDLPPDGMWQVVETELMKVEDYDRILEIGWPEFFKGFLSDRVFNDAAWNLLPANQDKVDIIGLWSDVGVPVLTGGNVTTPFELLCGSRSTEKFFLDLLEIPDKVEAVMELMIPHLALTNVDRMINHGYMVAWVGGWRTAPFMLSPRIWERFVWPYFQQQVNKVVEAGLIPLLHLDSNWDRELDRFKDFPKGKIIMALDGDTDIFRAKEILGDHICLMGDVPPTMLAFDTPDDDYQYSRKLIRSLGPEGFILQSGCDIPANATVENVQAMLSAALEN
ncbi:MAG: uroporphyrinogen decarboxylase family protein [Desulfobacterales bacterium]